MKNLFLIRHGKSSSNSMKNKDEGLPDNKVYLTEIGKQQAKEAGIFLKDYFENNALDYDSSIMFNSPFVRTRETSDIINEILDIKTKKEDPLLIEHQYGLFSDTDWKITKQKHPEFFEYYNNFYHNDGKFYVRFPMGESGLDVYVRTYLFLDRINKHYNDYENILVVTHGNVIKTFFMNLLDYSPEWFSHEKPINNCAIELIDEEKKIKILRK
ncbi:MAG: phosphoglycerate mutase family protein [Bacilli bacterium]|nr:phosphoglycerate mutase family protein [Bacilli bacterium]